MLHKQALKAMTIFGLTLFVSMSAFATGPAPSLMQQSSSSALGREKQALQASPRIDMSKLKMKDLVATDEALSDKPIRLKDSDKLKAVERLRGGDGSGGGNTINGKIIEKYRVDITQTPEYRTFVVPVLTQLKKIYSDFGESLEKVATKKTWYMIPIPIKTLPPKIVGLGHLDLRNVDYKQPSIQTLFSVWTDQNKYNQLGGLREKAEHLLHELALGLYENEFETNLAEAEEKARNVAAALMNVTDATTAEQFESTLDYKKLALSLAPNHKMNYPSKLDSEQIYMLIHEIKKIHRHQSCFTATYNQIDKTVTILCNEKEIMTVKEMSFGGMAGPDDREAYYYADLEINGDPNQAGTIKKVGSFSTEKFVTIKNLNVWTLISEVRYDVASKKAYIEWKQIPDHELK